VGYASKFGRARVSAKNPQAFAICDRCGFGYNHVDLRWQFDYAGAAIINKRILVCNSCYDTPNEQLRAIILPADPVPIMNPRLPDFALAESNVRFTAAPPTMDAKTGIPVPGGDPMGTSMVDPVSGQPVVSRRRVVQQTGEPPSGLNETPGLPYDNDTVPRTGNLK
jgi:hypothetical protein